MIESIVIKYLSEKLAVPVFAEVQEKEYPSFCIVEKTGSSKSDHIESATITVQSYSTTLFNASLLNEDVKNAMENIIDLENISECSLNSDYNYTDTTTKKYRYQSVFNITFN